jgi:hypothetical protein
MPSYPITTGVQALEELGLPPSALEDAAQLKFLDTAMRPFLDIVLAAKSVEVTPVVFSTLTDPDTDEMFRRHLEQVLKWPIQPRYMVVLGQHEGAGNRPRLSAERLLEMVPADSGIEVISQVAADQTPGQTNWFAEVICRPYGLSVIATSVHDSHGPRARATLLRSLIKQDLHQQVAMLPWSRPWNPVAERLLTADFQDEPRTDLELALRETGSIIRYTPTGSVATVAEMASYTNWLFRESPLATVLAPYT